MPPRRPDRALLDLLEGRYPVFTRTEARALGFTERQIAARTAAGRWVGVHESVFRLAGAPFGPRTRLYAATRAVSGPASNVSAAWLHGWEPEPPLHAHVTVTGVRRVDQAGIVAHHAAALAPGDVTDRFGIDVTAACRTLLDGYRDARVRQWAEAGVRDGSLSPKMLIAYADALPANQHHPRAAAFREVVAAVAGADKKDLEARFAELLTSARIIRPDAERYVTAGGIRWECDAVWRRFGLIVELDSRTWHDRMKTREKDLRKEVALERAGWRVVRFLWWDVVGTPELVVARLTDLLRTAA